MKEIALGGKNGVGKFTIVSDEDYEELSKYKWRFQLDKKTEWSGYVCRSTMPDKHIYMHRYIMGDKKGFFVDHKNRNTLDNTRDNLRHLTPHESNLNRVLKEGRGYTRKGKKWQAQARINGKQKYIGLYETEHEAHMAYKKALDTITKEDK